MRIITQSGLKDGTSRLMTGGCRKQIMTDLIWKLKTGCGFPISGSLSLLSRKYIMKRKKNSTQRRDSLNRWNGTARHGNGGIRRKRERESLLKFIQTSNNVPAGKYLLSIKGYVRKEKQKYPVPNCGFYLSLTKVEAFEGFKNPRETDEYDFNIGSME